ncbi:cell wall-active antibiotics response protein LiaF [Vagococcus jeotgali]|uniref:cell wall-active antibiotics response protein LiaF n=1 Tax=Vagococcus jeotgali TaxID=3109030 RepID=UPI002DDC81F9|nr:cell wall-active antibiotics response protein LiaF [Vagococcus sp. B2T-5]
MRSSWKFFLVFELLLLVWAMYQLTSNIPILVFLVIAILNLVYVFFKKRRTSFNQFQMIAALIVGVLCLLSSPAIWVMIIVGILYFGLVGVEFSGINILNSMTSKKKQIKMIKTTSKINKSGKRFKRSWIGSQRLGNDTYEWDDINMIVGIGDTIIDLGNTLLPKEDNVVIIRKGFGRTRILVPTGIGILLEHSSLRGSVQFDDELYQLSNESIKLYSQDYDEAARRLKIITSTLFGDIEVIRV